MLTYAPMPENFTQSTERYTSGMQLCPTIQESLYFQNSRGVNRIYNLKFGTIEALHDAVRAYIRARFCPAS